MVQKSIDVRFKRVESEMIWLSSDLKFKCWLSPGLRFKRFGCQLLRDSNEFGCQLI